MMLHWYIFGIWFIFSGNQLDDRDNDGNNKDGNIAAEKNNLKEKKRHFQIKTNQPFKKKDDDHDHHDVDEYGCESKSPKGVTDD